MMSSEECSWHLREAETACDGDQETILNGIEFKGIVLSQFSEFILSNRAINNQKFLIVKMNQFVFTFNSNLKTFNLLIY